MMALGALGVEAVPSGWQLAELKTRWSVIDCKHVTPAYHDDGFPVASITEVKGRFVDLTTAEHTTEEHYRNLIEGGREPLPGDLIFSRNVTIGEVAQVADWHPPFAVGQDVCIIRKRVAAQSSDFLQAVLKSRFVQVQIENLLAGSTFNRINVEQIRNLIVPVPSVDEQRAIAAALSDADALIAALDDLIAKKRAMKQGAMQELLTGRTRLPEFTGAWATNVLGPMAEVTKGEQMNRSTLLDDGYPVWNGGVTPSGCADRWNREGGAITISEGGNSCGFVGFVPEKFWCGGHCYVVMPRSDSLDKPFLYHALKFREKEIMALRVGSGLPNIQKERLGGFQFKVPELEEQRAIAAVLSDMDAEIAALDRRREKTRAIKQGMMQSLLTGRVRLAGGSEEAKA